MEQETPRSRRLGEEWVLRVSPGGCRPQGPVHALCWGKSVDVHGRQKDTVHQREERQKTPASLGLESWVFPQRTCSLPSSAAGDPLSAPFSQEPSSHTVLFL